MSKAVFSYIAATFVVESLSVGNAVHVRKRRQEAEPASEFDDVVITESGPSSFEINEKIEVSQMALMFLGRGGVIFSYLALDIYLFGDLAIYSTTVSKSMMNMICATVNTSTVLSADPCREIYRLCVILFVMVCTPMVIIGITKTKYLQLATTLSRWSAFTLMILLASTQMMANGAATIPPAANIHGFGSLFGVAVYAFMCHHSIPSLVTPMRASEQESLLEDEEEHDTRTRRANRPLEVSDVVIPVLVVGLPTIISLLTDDVLMLATVTGSYPGVGVQFLIPCLLVMRARTYAKGVLNFPVPKKFASPFQSKYWPYAIFLWAAVAIAMATVNTLGVRF
ncbi:hypothetical protein ANCDUO_10004 [Ancylostoma duodenale]|uniref:Transmembrane amino acid transporter protein n=1 Tax=Ancylostoma duodenale TaxID=51022 RepID=A0A0C2GLB6_9BILA|nr:hypothetical protein ANCDUO_10004 [Ancylostoma duodenale]